ncbi:hypothetical protein BDV96DRAFT_491408 [Lophiotrema nucula]|uniref:2'-5' RNA ligase superfamily-domain-containing protein n=1 Tax=Lophiotrema nucula TaxID=690887 RepID=A0A6A5ZBA6_9PLEO|nr:hypothetical protein BDV96DRAFT_491408 [Lophiotrema nucula]
MPDHKTTIATNRYEQSPKRFHLPNTGQEEQHVYVLTLKMTSSIAKPMNDMRLEHFPAHLNRTPAHLTLFHALPHSQISTMQNNLNAIATYAKPFPISTGTPFRIGRGVGIGLGEGAKDCIGLHDALRAEWLGFLSDQDQGGWKPHWTVMNKVSDEKQVKAAFNTIRRDLFENTYHGLVVGLDIWKYDHGKWDWMKEFNFKGLTKADMKSRKGSGGIKDMFKSMSVRKGLKKDYEW